MIIASLYSKPVNKSIAFHYGQKNNGYSAFIPNTRYLVYLPRLTDAIVLTKKKTQVLFFGKP